MHLPYAYWITHCHLVGDWWFILAEGSIVAGIGVSGAPGPELDEVCAKDGIDAIEDDIAF
jgi:uncharacterized protein GlcG (DUF336 family)